MTKLFPFVFLLASSALAQSYGTNGTPASIGADPVGVAATTQANTLVNYVGSFPSSCTVAGTNYTTQLDCAFYTMVANGGGSLTLGSGNYLTNAGLVEPTLGTQVSLIGQVEGFNGGPLTQITAGGSMQAILSHPDIPTGKSAPYGLRVQNIAFNGNGVAQQCLALYAEKLSVRKELTCRNYISTTLAPVQFGDPNPPSGYQSAGYQNYTEHIFVYGVGNGSWASVTPSQSGGTPTIAVNSGGTYVNPNPPVYFWGFQQSAVAGISSTDKPCSTMGMATAVMTGTGPYSVSSVTMSGYSGCSGLLYAYIPDMAMAPYGIEEAETDSHFLDLESENAGAVAGIHYASGGDFLAGDHAYGGQPIDFKIDNPQKAIVGLEADTSNIYGIEDNSGKNIYTSTEFVRPQLGAAGFHATNSAAISIIGSTCGGGTTTSNNFTMVVTPSGAVQHGFGAIYPGPVVDATQCDDLTQVNYYPNIQTQGMQMVNGGNVASSSGIINAVEFVLSTGFVFQTGNATNVPLKIQNINAAPTGDLVDFYSGPNKTPVGSIDINGNGHFANYIEGALTGDATTPGGHSNAVTLATVNQSPGSFGATTNTAGTAPSVPYFTVNGKGLVSASGAISIGTAGSYNTGTSGAVVPLLNAANTWGGAQSMPSAIMTSGGCLQNGTSSNAQICPNTSGTIVQTGVAGNIALKVANTNSAPTQVLQQWQGNGVTVGSMNPSGVLSLNATFPNTLYSAAGTALPACGSGTKGQQSVVSDATSPTYMGAYTSGGAVTAKVLCSYNGSSYGWVTD